MVKKLSQQDASKESIRFGISPPHTAGLLVNAIEPFEAKRLHARRSARDLASQNIEGAADAHDKGDVQCVAV